jgi:hypothetical protein
MTVFIKLINFVPKSIIPVTFKGDRVIFLDFRNFVLFCILNSKPNPYSNPNPNPFPNPNPNPNAKSKNSKSP